MTVLTKRRTIKEVQRLQKHWGFEPPLQNTVDYILKNPQLVSKELYKALSVEDFPEIRRREI